MVHAELCPVCQGRGVVASPKPLETGKEIPCHGCGGTGWVTVQDSNTPIPQVKG
jgi:DnaJ-class molecular chaperone